jgi:N-acetylglucosamine-6-sulfatase
VRAHSHSSASSGPPRRLGPSGAWVLLAAIVLGACEFVYPTPPPDDPVPTIVFSVDPTEPLDGEFTITATPVNFNPAGMGFRIDDYKSPDVILDSSAPYTLTMSTEDLTVGPHAFWASAGDGTYTVRKVFRPTFAQPPNIVVIQVDDLDTTTTPYWDAMPQTQALLADTGLTFENAFVTDPICCAARASLLTGRYPHNTGVFDNSPPDGGYQAFAGGADQDTIATRLQTRGYTTAYLGKYLNLYDPATHPIPPGWDEWFGLDPGVYWNGYVYNANHNGVLEHYGWEPEDYETDVLSARATAFVEASEADDDAPFYLQVNPLAPHANIGPAPRHQPNPFGTATVPTRPNTNEADVSDKPTWLREGFPLPSEDQMDIDTVRYRNAIGSLLAVDEMIAALVAELDQTGELANTVLLFTSDNGMNWRSHRVGHKMAPYEESIRVPFVLSGTGVPAGVQSEMVTNMDIAPTVLELAGAGVQDDLDGRSLLPLLKGNASGWRSDLLIQYRGTYGAHNPTLDTLADVQAEIARSGSLTLVPTYRALRTEEWLYVEWYGGTVHEYELYDLVNDPYELTNLLSTPEGVAAHEALTASLQARLEQLNGCSGASCRP